MLCGSDSVKKAGIGRRHKNYPCVFNGKTGFLAAPALYSR